MSYPVTKNIFINVDIDQLPVDALNIFSPNGDGIEDTRMFDNFEDFPECFFIVFDINGRRGLSFISSLPQWLGWYNFERSTPYGKSLFLYSNEGKTIRPVGNVNIIR